MTLANGTVTFNATTYGEDAVYECDVGYNLDGDRLRTCQDNGSWTGSAPVCNIVGESMPGVVLSLSCFVVDSNIDLVG